MLKSKIINLIDRVFVSACIFLIVYAWINFYIRSLWTTLTLAIIFSAAIIFVLYYFIDKKEFKSSKDKHLSTMIDKYNIGFRLLTKEQQIDVLRKVFSCKYNTSIGPTLEYTNNTTIHRIILATQYETLNQNDLINLISSNTNIRIDDYMIVCNSYSRVNTNLLKNQTITMIDKASLYALFEETQSFPDISMINDKINKFSWQEFWQSMLLKERARGYFFAGFVLIFSSILLPYHLYYIIVGSTLLMLAIVCKLLPFIKNMRNKS